MQEVFQFIQWAGRRVLDFIETEIDAVEALLHRLNRRGRIAIRRDALIEVQCALVIVAGPDDQVLLLRKIAHVARVPEGSVGAISEAISELLPLPVTTVAALFRLLKRAVPTIEVLEVLNLETRFGQRRVGQ